MDENKIFWGLDVFPKKRLPKINTAGVWGDDVFLQITSNIFNKNILLIPPDSFSSHNAGIYTYISALLMEDVGTLSSCFTSRNGGKIFC